MAATILWVIAWIGVSYVLMSVIEHFVHRFLMHQQSPLRFVYNAFETHAVLHHGTYFRGTNFDQCEDRASRYVSIDLGPFFMVLTTSPVWGVMVWLAGIEAASVFVSFAFAHGLVWALVHREMHNPQGRWWSRTWLFRYWSDYHREHHLHPGKNFNILCVGCDWLMRTLS